MMAEIIKADAAAVNESEPASKESTSKKSNGLLTDVERHQLLSSVCISTYA